MRQTVCFILATAASIAVVAVPLAGVVTHSALAQPTADQGEAPKQVPLTQALIDGLLGAQPALAAIQAKAGNAERPDAKAQAAMEAAAKTHGFADLDAYEAAADSVGLVLAGMDPETKTYIGPTALIKKQMAQVEADKSLPPKDKAETLKEMKEAMAAAGDIKPLPGNADLVAKNYDKLSEAFQSGE